MAYVYSCSKCERKQKAPGCHVTCKIYLCESMYAKDQIIKEKQFNLDRNPYVNKFDFNQIFIK